MIAKNIQIGEQDRPIAFPASALREIERMIGTDFLHANYFSYEFRIAMAFCGLKWGLYKGDGKEPKVNFTDIQVAEWIGNDMRDESISGQLLQILTDWMPKAKNVEAGEKPAGQ